MIFLHELQVGDQIMEVPTAVLDLPSWTGNFPTWTVIKQSGSVMIQTDSNWAGRKESQLLLENDHHFFWPDQIEKAKQYAWEYLTAHRKQIENAMDKVEGID